MATAFLYPNQIIALSKDAAQRLISSGNGDGALLYLHLLCQGADTLTPETAVALKWEGTRLAAAQQVLVEEGLLKNSPMTSPTPTAQPPLQASPEYSAADLAAEMSDPTSTFQGLTEVVQKTLGKVLSPSDLKYLLTIYDHLALPSEVILLLVYWCIQEHQEKYGTGRMPKLSTISRQAFTWKSNGIDTIEAAEAFFQRHLLYRSAEDKILAIVGIQGRKATPKERGFLEQWIDMKLEDEVIALAYETTLFRIQDFHWGYMHKILSAWHQKGFRTVAQIQEKDRVPMAITTNHPATHPKKSPSGEADRRVQEDMERMRAFIRAQKAKEGGESHGL